ncbi:unnamed protein product [Closterium sp. NIES-65]|nr:unnamed protein product [Closterium sp. NIES-65]
MAISPAVCWLLTQSSPPFEAPQKLLTQSSPPPLLFRPASALPLPCPITPPHPTQVLVSYGDLSSGVLALDFGFTVPDNPHDSVELCVLVASSTTPHDTQFNEAKRRLLGEAQLLPCDSARGACFVLK